MKTKADLRKNSRKNINEESSSHWPEEDYPLEEYPVWSVLVLCYKNRRMLNEMLDSIFQQNYPRIRLIVSDDGSPDFDEDEVRSYIAEHCEENIVEAIVRKNPENMKTVSHVKKVLELADDYLILTAADDRFAADDTITLYNRAFQKNPEALWLVAKCDVVTSDYQESIYITPTEEDEPFFLAGDARRLYSRWAHRGMAVPCSMAFKMDAFEVVGGIDLSYTYSEDWPLELKLLRNGYAPVYLPTITAVHSSGGVTNSNKTYGREVRRAFYEDKFRLLDQEVEAHFDLLEPDDQRTYRQYREEICNRAWFFDVEWEGNSWLGKLKLALSSSKHFWWVVEQQYMKRNKHFRFREMLYISQFLLFISYYFLSAENVNMWTPLFRSIGWIDLFVAVAMVLFVLVWYPLGIIFTRKQEKRRKLVN